MISRIFVDNYRALVNFELNLGRERLFLGRNGAGKTTVFDAVEAIIRFARGDASIDELFPIESMTRWNTQREQTFELDLVLADTVKASYRLVIEQEPSKDRRRVLEERVQYGSLTLFSSKLGEAQLYRDDGSEGPKVLTDWSRSSLPAIHEIPENQKITSIRQRLARIRNVRPDPRRMSEVSTAEASEPDRGLTNLVSWYRHLMQEDSERTDKMRDELRSIMEGFVTLNLKTEGKSRRMVTRWHGGAASTAAPVEYSLDELSDGQRVLFGLAMLAAEPGTEGLTLLLDEPDNFVALEEIQPLLMNMRLRDDLQLVVISHHPEVINLMARDHGLVFERRSFEATRVRPFKVDEDESLSPAELVARGEI